MSFLNPEQHLSAPPLRVHGLTSVSPHPLVFSAQPMFMRVALRARLACVPFKNTSAPTVNQSGSEGERASHVFYLELTQSLALNQLLFAELPGRRSTGH